eukprot:TRINITY_DN8728_c1_g2_i1.p1 TRINITY_DN8728_c1_g2~~TRINITY_DN8728_c1_g2_i1.p1  ORF type:complete len:156 (+),score=21.23 TRINITY_DN8728_c1_g2_i1:216-683(+)
MALAPFFTRDPVLNSIFGVYPDEFSTLFDHGPTKSYFQQTHAVANTAVDVKETSTAFQFVADLPGLKREEVKVQVEDGNTLTISGKRTREEKSATDTFHRIERSTGKFMRRFRLPDNADVKKVKASCQNGVLTVEVSKVPPKAPENPKTIEVEVA